MEVLTDERGAERIFAASIHCENLQRTHRLLFTHSIDEFGSGKSLQRDHDGFESRVYDRGTVDISKRREFDLQTRRNAGNKRENERERMQKVQDQRLTRFVGLDELVLLFGLKHRVCCELNVKRETRIRL